MDIVGENISLNGTWYVDVSYPLTHIEMNLDTEEDLQIKLENIEPDSPMTLGGLKQLIKDLDKLVIHIEKTVKTS